MRLSKANFTLGNSPKNYTSTNAAEFITKDQQYITKDERHSAVLNNQKTNFIHKNGFEKQISTGEKGPQPHKGDIGKEEIDAVT